ncbi:MAG: transketolase [Chloroflexi bacterium]|nr:transketolase [Chloroflexota bacterium]
MVVRDLEALEARAVEMRREIVKMMGANKAHHFGGSLSATDIVTALYFYRMRYDPARPDWPERDRFIMSKGHCVPAQYVALAMRGVFPMAELATLKRLGTRLQGHPAAHLLPGIEGCTGSLGQGLSFANGMALAGRMRGIQYDVFCLIGDGESQEGQIWEAVRTAATQCLGNVTAILDRNGLKAMDTSYCGKDLGGLDARFQAFGWHVREIDGHNMAELCEALDWAHETVDAPCLIIARTIKGKGVPFMENRPEYHNAALSPEQVAEALAALESPRAVQEA